MGLMLYERRHLRIHRSRPRHITTIFDNNSQYSVVSLQQVYSYPIIMPKNPILPIPQPHPVLTPRGPVWASAPPRCSCSSSSPCARSWAPAVRRAPRGTDAFGPAPPAARSASPPAQRWKPICPRKARHWGRHLGVSNWRGKFDEFLAVLRDSEGEVCNCV